MLESQYSFHHNFKICQGCKLLKKEVISSLLTDKALALSIPTVVGIFLFFVVAVAVAIAVAVGGFAVLLFSNSWASFSAVFCVAVAVAIAVAGFLTVFSPSDPSSKEKKPELR